MVRISSFPPWGWGREVYFKFLVVCHVKILSHLQMLTNNQQENNSCFKLSHREMASKERSVLYREGKKKKGEKRKGEEEESLGRKRERSWKEDGRNGRIIDKTQSHTVLIINSALHISSNVHSLI